MAIIELTAVIRSRRMPFEFGTALAGLAGVGVGAYVQFALQRDRNRREERSALMRLDALLGDIEIFVKYAAGDGRFEQAAWEPRVARLMRHTELPALATAFTKKPDRYAYALRVAAAIERQMGQLSSPNLAPPTQDDIDDWAAKLRRKYDKRLLARLAVDSHGDLVRAWAEHLVSPISHVRDDLRDEMSPHYWWDIKAPAQSVTASGIVIASREDLQDPEAAAERDVE